MKALGIDPGTVTGWAVVGGPGDVRVGTWKLKGPDGRKGYDFARHVHRAIGRHNPGVVMIESAMFIPGERGGVASASLRFGLRMAAMIACESIGCPYVMVPVSTLKVHATGDGRADKTAMCRAAFEATGMVMTADEADAYWLADFGSAGTVPA